MNFYKSLDSAIVLVIVNFGLEPKTNNYIEQTKTLSLAKPNQTRTKTNVIPMGPNLHGSIKTLNKSGGGPNDQKKTTTGSIIKPNQRPTDNNGSSAS